MFELKNVSKQFGAEYALRDITMQIGSGLNFIIGASGSGKTTLLKIISGMEQDFEGEALYCGQSIKTLTGEEKSYYYNHIFGFVWQDFNLLDDLSVLENVMLPGYLKQAQDKIDGLYNRYKTDSRVQHIVFTQAFNNILITVDGKEYKVDSSGSVPTVNRLTAGTMPTGAGNEVVVPNSFVKMVGLTDKEVLGKMLDFDAAVYNWDSGEPVLMPVEITVTVVGVLFLCLSPLANLATTAFWGVNILSATPLLLGVLLVLVMGALSCIVTAMISSTVKASASLMTGDR